MAEMRALCMGILAVGLGTGLNADDDPRTLPAVHRPDRYWRHRGPITIDGAPCPQDATAYERLHREEPGQAAHLRCLILRRVQAGKGDASTPLRAWTASEPSSFHAWVLRAVVMHDLDAAREAVWLRPDDADAWNLVGMLCADAGCASGLDREAFRTAVRLRPDFGEAWTNLALASQNDYSEAEARETQHAAREAVRLQPELPLAWMALGHSAFSGVRVIGDDEATRARWAEAARAYEHLVLLQPLPHNWSTLATALRAARNPALSRETRARLKLIDEVRARELP
jgi:hypothetical protein